MIESYLWKQCVYAAMRKFIKTGYRIEIEETYQDVSTFEDDITIKRLPPILSVNVGCSDKADVLKVVDAYFEAIAS